MWNLASRRFESQNPVDIFVILVNVMPGDKSIRSGRRRDSCGEPVSDLGKQSWVEWFVADDT